MLCQIPRCEEMRFSKLRLKDTLLSFKVMHFFSAAAALKLCTEVGNKHLQKRGGDGEIEIYLVSRERGLMSNSENFRGERKREYR